VTLTQSRDDQAVAVAVDLFRGAGGWSVAARALGILDLGVENMAEANATAEAAGFVTAGLDVWEFDAILRSIPCPQGEIASPPCQTFSRAGKGAGRAALDAVLTLAAEVPDLTLPELRAAADRFPLDKGKPDERTALVLTPLWYALNFPFRWLAWEQVPAVLPVWEACAEILRERGWSVWVGVLKAEKYGVPQTRERAVLIASLDREVSEPTPTHSRYHNRTPDRLDEGVLHWVSMAEALGWGSGDLVGFPRLADSEHAVEINGTDYRARDLREAGAPAQAITEKARSWSRFGAEACPCDMIGAVVGSPGTAHRADCPEFAQVTLQTDTHAREFDRSNPRTLDQPAPTVRFGHAADSWRWRVERPIEAPAEAILYVNGTHEKAARRPASAPAPTIMFGARQNTVEWQALVAGGVAGDGTPRDVEHPSPTIAGKGTAAWIDDTASYLGTAKNPGPGRAALEAEVEPRVNNQSGTAYDLAEQASAPASVLAARDLVTFRGANANRFNGATKSRNDGVRVTVQEAAVLQSFPVDHPWQGTKTKQYLQVGNAVPPLLALHVLAEAAGIDLHLAETEPPAGPGEPGLLSVRTSMGEPIVGNRNGTHRLDPHNRPAHTVTTKVGEWRVEPNPQEETPRMTDNPAPDETTDEPGPVAERPKPKTRRTRCKVCDQLVENSKQHTDDHLHGRIDRHGNPVPDEPDLAEQLADLGAQQPAPVEIAMPQGFTAPAPGPWTESNLQPHLEQVQSAVADVQQLQPAPVDRVQEGGYVGAVDWNRAVQPMSVDQATVSALARDFDVEVLQQRTGLTRGDLATLVAYSIVVKGEPTTVEAEAAKILAFVDNGADVSKLADLVEATSQVVDEQWQAYLQRLEAGPAPVLVEAPDDSRIAQLQAAYAVQKAQADAATDALKTTVDALKFELIGAVPDGTRKIELRGAGDDRPGLRVTYSEPRRVKGALVKAADPALYERCSHVTPTWTLKPLTDGPES
jgi:DNA (cytosine-5)-methyltransferase 1